MKSSRDMFVLWYRCCIDCCPLQTTAVLCRSEFFLLTLYVYVFALEYCFTYYRQECLQGKHWCLVYSEISFWVFAPHGWHVAQMGVKFGVKGRHITEMGWQVEGIALWLLMSVWQHEHCKAAEAEVRSAIPDCIFVRFGSSLISLERLKIVCKFCIRVGNIKLLALLYNCNRTANIIWK